MKQKTAANATDTMRLFYALWPDDATRTKLMQLQASMHGRMTRYENLHITLAFLGQQPAGSLPALKEVLARLPRTAMTLTIDRLGYFTKNRIAWVGMHDAPADLFTVQRTLAQALAQQNVSFDNRPDFKPHITLVRDAAPPPDIVFTPITWRANQAVLVQSLTQPNGSGYRVLASRSLDEDVWTPNELGQDVLDSGR